jgi:hypothetical protein
MTEKARQKAKPIGIAGSTVDPLDPDEYVFVQLLFHSNHRDWCPWLAAVRRPLRLLVEAT